jgi:transposase
MHACELEALRDYSGRGTRWRKPPGGHDRPRQRRFVEAAQPLLPPGPCTTHGGPPRVPHRAALAGILHVLRHGLRWRDLPRELGYGSGSTCWRRLRRWQAQGIWRRVHQVLLDWLGDPDAIDWSRAKRGASTPARTPPIAPKRARSTTSWSTAKACPWPCGSRRPTCTTPSCSSRWPMRSSRSAGPRGSRAARASARPRCTATRASLPPSATGVAAARDHAADRSTGRGLERAAGSLQMGGRARSGLDRGVPPARTRYDRRRPVSAFLHLACALICLRYLAHAEAEAH